MLAPAAQTTGYTSLVTTGRADEFIIVYDRLINSWSGPNSGKYPIRGADSVWTMRVRLRNTART